MADLKIETPFGALLPVEVGGVRLEAAEAGWLTSLAPLGGPDASGAALQDAHGMAWPAPNRATGKEGARCIWFGHEAALLMGPEPAADLAGTSAVVDQSDGWAVAVLEGAAAEDVLARLVPVDLRRRVFKRGRTVRSQMKHMPASITRTGPDRFLILVFRSMAATLVHELKTAMAAVASRR